MDQHALNVLVNLKSSFDFLRIDQLMTAEGLVLLQSSENVADSNLLNVGHFTPWHPAISFNSLPENYAHCCVTKKRKNQSLKNKKYEWTFASLPH